MHCTSTKLLVKNGQPRRQQREMFYDLLNVLLVNSDEGGRISRRFSFSTQIQG
jgi:hypothetical protein